MLIGPDAELGVGLGGLTCLVLISDGIRHRRIEFHRQVDQAPAVRPEDRRTACAPSTTTIPFTSLGRASSDVEPNGPPAEWVMMIGGTDLVQHLRAVLLPDADLGILDQAHAVAEGPALRGDQLRQLGRADGAGSRPLIVELRVGRIAARGLGLLGSLRREQARDRIRASARAGQPPCRSG